MKLAFAAILAISPTLVSAEDWTQLRDDAAIKDALSDQTLVYDAYTFQQFSADGATRYLTERVSDGRWAARGGQYCSVWPPSDVWTCYDFEVKGGQVRFISSDQSISVGTFRK